MTCNDTVCHCLHLLKDKSTNEPSLKSYQTSLPQGQLSDSECSWKIFSMNTLHFCLASLRKFMT